MGTKSVKIDSVVISGYSNWVPLTLMFTLMKPEFCFSCWKGKIISFFVLVNIFVFAWKWLLYSDYVQLPPSSFVFFYIFCIVLFYGTLM